MNNKSSWFSPLLRKILKALFVIASVLILSLLLLIFVFMYLPARHNSDEWRRNADAGNPSAQYGLGRMHLTGEAEYRSFGRVRQDNKKAVFYLGKAARAGEKHAYFPYALSLERDGQREAAAIWYKKAADYLKTQKDAESQMRSVTGSEK